MSDDKGKLIERIRKLLALAGSSNEHEAALATEKAQALLAEHNLSLSEVGEEKVDDEIIEDDLTSEPLAWTKMLNGSIAELYFCTYFYVELKRLAKSGPYTYKYRHVFVGASHNTIVAKLMSSYLTSTVKRLATDGHEGQWAYITSFCNACSYRLVSRIRKRLADSQAAPTTTSTGTQLPALLSLYEHTNKMLQTYIADKYPKMKTNKSKVRINDAAGYIAGRAAGDKISLDAQLEATKRKALPDA